MNPFNAFKKREKEDRKEMDQREQECRKAIEAVLLSYQCELSSRLVFMPQAVVPDIQIVALPKQDGKPAEQPADAGAAKPTVAPATSPKDSEAREGSQTPPQS